MLDALEDTPLHAHALRAQLLQHSAEQQQDGPELTGLTQGSDQINVDPNGALRRDSSPLTRRQTFARSSASSTTSAPSPARSNSAGSRARSSGYRQAWHDSAHIACADQSDRLCKAQKAELQTCKRRFTEQDAAMRQLMNAVDRGAPDDARPLTSQT